MSLGADRVRMSFNTAPRDPEIILEFKSVTARLIDMCEDGRRDAITVTGNGEEARLWALAMTAYEEACMWAVKAATTKKGEAFVDAREYPSDHPAPGDLGSVPT